MNFTVTPAEDSVDITAAAGSEEIAELSGHYTMISATTGFTPYLGGRLWIDLVPDDFGDIQWLRFAARLLPRLA